MNLFRFILKGPVDGQSRWFGWINLLLVLIIIGGFFRSYYEHQYRYWPGIEGYRAWDMSEFAMDCTQLNDDPIFQHHTVVGFALSDGFTFNQCLESIAIRDAKVCRDIVPGYYNAWIRGVGSDALDRFLTWDLVVCELDWRKLISRDKPEEVLTRVLEFYSGLSGGYVIEGVEQYPLVGTYTVVKLVLKGLSSSTSQVVKLLFERREMADVLMKSLSIEGKVDEKEPII